MILKTPGSCQSLELGGFDRNVGRDIVRQALQAGSQAVRALGPGRVEVPLVWSYKQKPNMTIAVLWLKYQEYGLVTIFRI